jgi:hypothetical protein
MTFRPDGGVGGSVGYSAPPGLHWHVERDSAGRPQFCAMVANDGSDGFCRDYHLDRGRLELVGGPVGRTIFRRVP